jgi:hypothetical protein
LQVSLGYIVRLSQKKKKNRKKRRKEGNERMSRTGFRVCKKGIPRYLRTQ